jgi:CBS domain-containing protein
MDKNVPPISANMSVSDVIKIFGSTSSYYYAVVDAAGRPIGAITFDSIRNTFATGELHSWLIALDVMEHVPAVLTPDTRLARALEIAKHVDAEFLPVVSSSGDGRFEGVLDCSSVHHKLSARILELHRQADSAV